MSYNIMKKRAGFAGSTEGTIENIVDTHTDQAISGSKSFSNTVTSSADVMLSGSGKVSASFFYGDGSGLSGVSSDVEAQGPVESIQFHTGSGGLSGSANLTFLTSSNTLEVTGDISASINISASSFYGDGSNLTDITASNISGQLSASQISFASPLSNSAGNLTAKTDINRLISADASGIHLNTTVADASTRTNVNDSDKLITYNGGAFHSIQFSAIESSLNIGGGNITGSNSINNAVLPTIINQSVISASTGISGAFFQGDGSGLTGVTASPTPAGANTQIQFNDDGALAGDADLTFLTGSNTLATTIVSASAHVSASEFATAGGTVIDSAGNFQGNNAFFDQITASSDISSSGDVYGQNFRGNGSTLNNVPLVQSNGASVVFIDNAGNQTITSNANFRYNGSDVFNDAGGFSGSADLQVGGHISGSGDLRLLNDGSIRLGGSSTISFDDGAGQLSSISQGGTNQLTIEAHNRLTIKTDEYVIFHDSANNERLVVDYRTTDPTPIQIIRTDLPISSSDFVSASSYATAGGTVITDEGNFQGNNASFNEITASSVISSSAEISASSFHGDGSALTGVGGSTTFEDHIKTSSYFVFNAGTYWIPLAGNNPAARNQLDNATFQRWGGIHYVAPASGSLKRFKMIAFNNSQTIYSATPSKIDIILTLSKNDTTVSAASATGAPYGHITASANTYVVASGSYGLVWDIPIEGNSEFSGSNTFDPGDVLKMTNRFASVQAAGNNYDTQMTITFELSGSDD